jgi:hypothetical protein
MKDIKNYTAFRDQLKETFMEKYGGLNIAGTDYRQYIFNFFENAIQRALDLDL